MLNWAGNHEYRCRRLHYPRSVHELQNLVRRSKLVRILGSRHSFNDIADCSEDIISLKQLDKAVRFDGIGTLNPTVTVEGGITYAQLCHQLEGAGLALRNLASLLDISVAGACATATHGSGDRNPNLAAAVVAMKIVKATGDEVDVSRASVGESFDEMVVSLGALGAVSELTLKLESSFEIRQEVYLNLPMNQMRNHFDEITSRAYSVSLFTDLRSSNYNQVWLKHRVGDEEPVACGTALYEAMPAATRMHPLAHLPAENCTEQMGIRGPWHERLSHFRAGFTPSNGVELQSEYFVPRNYALDAIDAIFGMRADIAPLLQISEVRTIAQDDLLMSPCYKQACVGIHFTWQRNLHAVMGILPKIEEQLAAFEARPHWGKLFAMTGAELARLYGPRLTRFRELIDDFDPIGKFRNAFLDRCIFGSADGRI